MNDEEKAALVWDCISKVGEVVPPIVEMAAYHGLGQDDCDTAFLLMHRQRLIKKPSQGGQGNHVLMIVLTDEGTGLMEVYKNEK